MFSGVKANTPYPIGGYVSFQMHKNPSLNLQFNYVYVQIEWESAYILRAFKCIDRYT